MKKEQIRHLRVTLLFAWIALSGLLLLLGGCMAALPDEDTEVPPVPTGKYAVSFAPLAVAGEVETRAPSVMVSGTVRLFVYAKSASFDNDPIANRTYTVANGILTEAGGAEPLQLEAGEYVFYALSPSAVNPIKGVASGVVRQGVDLLASLTPATISAAGTEVTLASLSHKGSNVSFTVSRATEGATFVSMEMPSSLTLYSQATEPATFQLGEEGGSLVTSAGTTTVVLGGTGRAFTRPDAAKEEYRASCPVLPKLRGTFNVAIQTKLVLKSGEQPQTYTLRAKVPECVFEAGNTYNFHIRVEDPRQQGDVVMSVTPWNKYAWEDSPY